MKTLISVLIVLGLILIPITTNAQELTCYPPEEWREEYSEWIAWQQQLQQEFTNETGYGLGMLLTFSQWAEYREGNKPYWWLPEPTSVPYWQGCSYLFCDSNGIKETTTWSWLA